MNANETNEPSEPSEPNRAAPPQTITNRYRIDRILGTNAAGGRVTYLAQVIDPGIDPGIDPQQPDPVTSPSPVVLKEFQFAQTGNSWQGYDAITREFEILQSLDHPGIPRYIEQFETDRAVYLVQDYKDAPTLATRIANPSESDEAINLASIYQAAIDLLEILTYLQTRVPPVLHRDLKPENILLSATGEVFLVDFGFARRGISGEGEGTASSLVRGTLGFMAPEQILNRSLTTATDLYGLGATLVCWLTGTPSDRVGDWIGEGFQFDLDRAVAQLPKDARLWLAKLVAMEVADRFDSARSALEALRMISFEAEADVKNGDPDSVDSRSSSSVSIPLNFPLQVSAQSLQTLSRSLAVLPLQRLVLLAIASGLFVWGFEGWWAFSVSAGRAIDAALRSLLSI